PAAELRRERVRDGERAREQLRVQFEVRLEQINASAVERHHGGVRQLQPVRDVHLQDLVLGRRTPAVRPEQVLDGVAVDLAVPADDACADLEREGGPGYAQRIRRSGERALRRLRAAE